MLTANNKVNFSNLHYSLKELFEHTPVFDEPVIRYGEVSVNPTEDLPVLEMQVERGNKIKEYNAWVDRYNTEMLHKAQTPKNNWKQIENLVLSRKTRDQVMDKKREYNDLKAL